MGTILNECKYKSVVLYFLEKTGPINGKKKFFKLLYFLDFDYFEKYGTSITGDIYFKKKYGPVPKYLEAIIMDLKKEGYVEVKSKKIHPCHENSTQIYKIKKQNKDYLKNLNKKEIEMLDRVIKLYVGQTGKTLEDISHNQAPWNAVEYYEEIPYEMSLYRDTNFNNEE